MKINKKSIGFCILIIGILVIILGFILNFTSNKKTSDIPKNENNNQLSRDEVENIAKDLEGSEGNDVKIQELSESFIVQFTDKTTGELIKSYLIDKKDGKVHSMALANDTILGGLGE